MASLLLPGKAQFFDADGKPLAGGSVTFSVPGTTTPKATWQDAAATILNTNPVILDAAGEAVIYGSGAYRQVLQDSAGNEIWDQETAEPGAQLETTNILGDLTVGGSTFLANAATTGNLNVGQSFAVVGLTSLTGVTNTGDLNCGGSFTVFGNVGVTGTTTFGPVVDAIDFNVHGSFTAFGNAAIVGSAHIGTLFIDGSFSGTADGWQLFPSGTGAFSGAYTLGISSGAGVLGTTFISASDARVKTEIEDVPLADAYRFVRDVRAKVFLKDGSPDAGFIAQDAITNGFQRMVVVSESDDPRMATGDGDVSPIGKRLNLNYNHATAYHHRMIVYLLDAVEDLQAQIARLKN